jgi:hypothetical protein
MDEGMSPSSLNDSIRQLMADVRTEWAQGADIASASTTDLSAATGGYVVITGTVTITAFGTASAGIRRKLRFSGALILTHNATSLILPTGGNITTVAGDTCEVMSEGSGNWRVLWYAGKTVQAASIVAASIAAATLTASTSAAWGTGIANFGTIAKRKTADESVTSSTTLQDDDHLTFAIAANEEWTIQFLLTYGDVLTTTGIKMAVTTPSGATQRIFAHFVGNGGDAALAASVTVNTAFFSSTPSVSTQHVTTVNAWVLNGATPGNVTLQWAQNASSGTALTFKKGSFMQATRIA